MACFELLGVITVAFEYARAVQKCCKLSIPSHGPMESWDYMGLSIPSHSPWDIPWNVHLSLYRCMCPTVHPIPRSHETFHGMSTCPSTDACVLLSIPSHGPMRPWDIPRDVHLSLSMTHECLTVPLVSEIDCV